MYDNPDASPADLKDAVLKLQLNYGISITPRFLNKKMLTYWQLFLIYDRRISYLPDYPIGHLLLFKLREQMKKQAIWERIYAIGSDWKYSPDLWMKMQPESRWSVQRLWWCYRQSFSKVLTNE